MTPLPSKRQQVEDGEPSAVANGCLATADATMTVVLDFVNGAS
jgi:hypothetical protein